MAPLGPQYVLFVPTDEVRFRLLFLLPLVLEELTRLRLAELLALLPSLANPLLELRNVVVVAEVQVDAVDRECRRRRFLRNCFLCMSTNDNVRHPKNTQMALK